MTLRFWSALLLTLTASSALAVPTQLLLPSPSAATVQVGGQFAVQVDYSTVDPVDSTLRGLSVRMHFDSKKLQFNGLQGVLQTNLLTVTAAQPDSGDFDADPATDQFVVLTWIDDANNAWPGTAQLPVTLFTANFTTLSTFGSGTSLIRFSPRITAPDFGFQAAPVLITGQLGPDVTPPVITLTGGALFTVIQPNIFADPGAVAIDDRDGNISARILIAGSVNSLIPGDYPLTYTVSDFAGNAATPVVRTVRVLPPDVTPPVVTPPNNVQREAIAPTGVPAASLAAFLMSATANDDRYGPLPVTNNAPTTFFPLGDTTVTFRAVDGEGNVGTAIAVVSVVDTTGPVLNPIVGITVEAESANGTPASNAQITAFLNSARAVDVVGGVTISNNAPTLFPLGNTVVTFTALDGFQNTATVNATVSVLDTTAPQIIPPEPATVEATSAAGVSTDDEDVQNFLGGVSVSDLVDSEPSLQNDVPTPNVPLGANLVTFTASDSDGNTAQASATLSVVDTTPPVVAAGNTITVVERGNGQISRDDAVFAALFAAVSATDAVDDELDFSDDAADFFTVGTNTVTFFATDDSGNEGSASADVIVLTAGDGDQDDDGMPDNFEVANQLNPNDPTDADDDNDNDGFTNLEEFQNGTDPNRDSVLPVVVAPQDISVAAAGPLTPVSLGAATATDVPDGTLPVVVSGDRGGVFLAGRSVVTYSATDQAGNVGRAQQMVDVTPLVALGPAQRVSEGQAVLVDVLLSGNAIVYPVTIDFTVGGTATNPEDHNLAAGTVTITSGRTGQITFDVLADGATEGQETVSITLQNATNVAIGPRNSTVVTIVEANQPPRADIMVRQGQQNGATVLRTGGTVTAQALVSDPNRGDTATFSWSGSSAALVAISGQTSASFQFDPSALNPGVYMLSVVVTDAAGAAATTRTFVRVLANAPTLSTTADTDGDGINDAADGAGDDDGDGVPNFQDAFNGGELLGSAVDSNRFLLQTEPGLRVAIGQVALAAGRSGPRVLLTDITSFGSATGGVTQTGDINFAYDVPFYDIVIQGVNTGDSAAIVIPLTQALAANTTLAWRKFIPGAAFATFVEDARNSVRSAPGQLGVCPGVGSSAYVPGLNAGSFCVQLTIEDGGPNDTDRARNGQIADPGTVGRALPAPPPPPVVTVTPSGGGGGGGCAVGDGSSSGDLGLPLLMAGGLLYALRRRWRGESARE